MKKACGAWFVFYLLLAAGAGLLVYRRLPDPGVAAVAGVIGGGVLWLGFGYFFGIKAKLAAARMIRNALSGVPPVDGEKVAAIGRIEPNGSPLISPLSKTSCVAYKYAIATNSGDDEISHYDGFALMPSTIHSMQGSFKLLALPDFMKISLPPVQRSIAVPNAKEYVAATQFREPAIINFRKSFKDMLDLQRDDDGSVRMDQQGMHPYMAGQGTKDPLDWDTLNYREWVLRPGENVCVIGRYSAQRGGIVPSDSPLADPVTLEIGPPEAYAGRAAAGATGTFIGGVIFIGIALAAFALFLAFVPLTAAVQMNPSLRFTWPEVRLERWIETNLRTRMRKVGMINSGESVSTMLSLGVARGRVRGGGIDETLSKALAHRENGLLRIEIDNGKVTIDEDPKGQPTRLAIRGRDVPLADASIEVSGTIGHITYYSDDLACHVSFYADVIEAAPPPPPPIPEPQPTGRRGKAASRRR